PRTSVALEGVQDALRPLPILGHVAGCLIRERPLGIAEHRVLGDYKTRCARIVERLADENVTDRPRPPELADFLPDASSGQPAARMQHTQDRLADDVAASLPTTRVERCVRCGEEAEFALYLLAAPIAIHGRRFAARRHEMRSFSVPSFDPRARRTATSMWYRGITADVSASSERARWMSSTVHSRLSRNDCVPNTVSISVCSNHSLTTSVTSGRAPATCS